jgi:hypothetical protein
MRRRQVVCVFQNIEKAFFRKVSGRTRLHIGRWRERSSA